MIQSFYKNVKFNLAAGHFHLQAELNCNSKNSQRPVILTMRAGFGLRSVQCPSLFYTNKKLEQE